MKKGKSNNLEASNVIRIWELANGVQELKNNWRIGLGFGTKWTIHYPPFFGDPPTRTRFHNTYMCMWVKYGIVGLFLFVWLIISKIFHGLILIKNNSSPEPLVIMASFFILYFGVVSNIGDMPYYIRPIALLSLSFFIIEFFHNQALNNEKPQPLK